jgi:uncharacterized membrane protein YjjP (DUF1212 family)
MQTCHITVAYAVVSVDGEGPAYSPVSGIHYNTVALREFHALLARMRSRELSPAEALPALQRVQAETPRKASWLVAVVRGAGAALVGLLGADLAAAAVASLSTSLGFLARQAMHGRHLSLLVLPFAAAFVGGITGGLGVRLGLTTKPWLAFLAPCLMLVPGLHLINGLLDVIDNHLSMAARETS